MYPISIKHNAPYLAVQSDLRLATAEETAKYKDANKHRRKTEASTGEASASGTTVEQGSVKEIGTRRNKGEALASKEAGKNRERGRATTSRGTNARNRGKSRVATMRVRLGKQRMKKT